jgi:cation diffusion facilitator CzcD-associated flavoprotein CzcO
MSTIAADAPGTLVPPPGDRVPHVGTAVIGAGFSGLGTAIRLLQRGDSDFVVFERAEQIGGTWRDNSYPGAACDVMSLLYSFSFAPHAGWTTTFGKRDEIFAYLNDCATRFGVRPHLRFGHDLLSARWDDQAQRWNLRTSQGDYTATSLVAGTGYLSDAALPQIPGLESFAGDSFHSSAWRHDLDLTGKRVAVIGTGASAVQFVPKIQPQVGRLDVYQRTAAWVAPKGDKPTSDLQFFLRRSVPGYQKLRRGFNMWGREILAFMMARPAVMEKTIQDTARKHLHSQVADPVLRAKLTPSFSAGCKRLLFSNDFYPALAADNAEVVTDGISEVRPDGILTADGTFRPADVIIFGTGFQATSRPVAGKIIGRHGETLAETWQRGMSAYAGTTVAGFPNLYLMLGPNTTLGHSSQTVMIEAQIGYVLGALDYLSTTGASSLEVREEAVQSYTRRIDQALEGSVWNSGNCQSWYRGDRDRNSSIWPTYTWRFRAQTRRFDPDSYRRVTRRASVITTRADGEPSSITASDAVPA